MSQGQMSNYTLANLGGVSPIQGGLSVGGGGAGLFSGLGSLTTNPQAALSSLGGSYASAYQSALSANQQNYQNILSGYQQTAQAQAAAQQPIAQGYNQLGQSVQQMLGIGQPGSAVGAGGQVQNTAGNWGVAAPAAQAISDTLAAQQGASTQGLIGSGLGNTTVLNSVRSGNALQAQKAYGALGAQLAQTATGYLSQIGQAGLNYANQANMQNTALAGQQLGFMGNVQIPYPSASVYGQLASGAAGLALAQRAPLGSNSGSVGFVRPQQGSVGGGTNLGGPGPITPQQYPSARPAAAPQNFLMAQSQGAGQSALEQMLAEGAASEGGYDAEGNYTPGSATGGYDYSEDTGSSDWE